MAQARHLNHAPLREALIDIQFDAPLPLQAVLDLANSKASKFDRARDLRSAWVGLHLTETDAKTSGQATIVGKRLESSHPPHVVQYRVNGFTFSRLHPYESWKHLADTALPLWEEYAAVGVSKITRIALRYINEVKLPIGAELSDYLASAPHIPQGLPQDLAGFLQRFVIVNQPAGCTAIVTQALEDSPDGAARSEATVVLDIDAFWQGSTGPHDEQLITTLEALHNFKNDLFFKLVTERTLELFE